MFHAYTTNTREESGVRNTMIRISFEPEVGITRQASPTSANEVFLFQSRRFVRTISKATIHATGQVTPNEINKEADAHDSYYLMLLKQLPTLVATSSTAVSTVTVQEPLADEMQCLENIKLIQPLALRGPFLIKMICQTEEELMANTPSDVAMSIAEATIEKTQKIGLFPTAVHLSDFANTSKLKLIY